MLYESILLSVKTRAACTASCTKIHWHEPEITANRLKDFLLNDFLSNPTGVNYGQHIRSLEVIIESNSLGDLLLGLFCELETLQHLHIKMKAPRCQQGLLAISIFSISTSLTLSTTLKSLCLHVNRKFLTRYSWPYYSISDLHHLVSLERLQLQGYLLFSDFEHKRRPARCRWRLPSQLKELRLRYYIFDGPQAPTLDKSGHHKHQRYTLVFLRPLTRFLIKDQLATPSLRTLSLELPTETAALSSAGKMSELEKLIESAGLRGIEVQVSARHPRSCKN